MKQINLLKSGKAVRNAQGKVIKEADYQSKLAPGTQARVLANRKWFENTRVVGQKELEAFRAAVGEKKDDPYTFLMRQNKLPMSLLTDTDTAKRMNLLTADSFKDTFGLKATRKRPTTIATDFSELAAKAALKEEGYCFDRDVNDLNKISISGVTKEASDPHMQAGTSRRIYSELYKVIDSSDVLIHVLDARDPVGTRCRNVERYIKKEAPHKHLIFVLNKCDLVPTWATVLSIS